MGGARVRCQPSWLITKRLLLRTGAESLTTSQSVGSHNRERRQNCCNSTGARHLRASGHDVRDDDTAWCATRW